MKINELFPVFSSILNQRNVLQGKVFIQVYFFGEYLCKKMEETQSLFHVLKNLIF